MLRHFFFKHCLVFCGFFFYAVSGFCSEQYFLCGPDEDGCFENEYKDCACIPHDHVAYSPHCLDFSTLRCKPLVDMPHCPAHLIYKNQGDCIATIFHSTPMSPCHVKTREFCVQHKIMFCDYNGEPSNCHMSPD